MHFAVFLLVFVSITYYRLSFPQQFYDIVMVQSPVLKMRKTEVQEDSNTDTSRATWITSSRPLGWFADGRISSGFASRLPLHGASLVAQLVKNSLAMQDTWIQSLGQEDSLEEEMANYSSILFRLFSLIGCYRLLRIVPYALQ